MISPVDLEQECLILWALVRVLQPSGFGAESEARHIMLLIGATSTSSTYNGDAT